MRCDEALDALMEVTERQSDEIAALDASLAQEVAERERRNNWYNDATVNFVVGIGLGIFIGTR